MGTNENPKFTCKFFARDEDASNVSVFTERGLAFFLSLFLEQKYVALLFAEMVENVVKNTFLQQVEALPVRTFQREGKTVTLPHNSTFLIQKYHEWSGDDWQWFHDLSWDGNSKPFQDIAKLFSGASAFNVTDIGEHYGEIVKKLKAKRRSLSKDNQVKFTSRINRLDKHLKNLRQAKLQDIILLRMVKELLELSDVKMSDIREQQVGAVGDNEKNRFLLEQEYEFERQYKIASLPPSRDEKVKREVDLPLKLVGKMKVKNYGNFFRLTNDIRIPSLLRLLRVSNQTDSFEYQRLQDDLDKYEDVRFYVFKRIHDLERTVLERLPSLVLDEEGKKKEYVDFGTIVAALSNVPSHKIAALNILRNAISHHYYPEFIYEPEAGTDQDVAEFTGMMLEKQFRNQLVEKTLPTMLPDGKPATMARRVLRQAKKLFDEVMTSAQSLQEQEVNA